MQSSSHRRSFVGTTIVAICCFLALLLLVGAIVYLSSRTAQSTVLLDRLIRFSIGVVIVILLGLAAAAAMVAIGGLAVIHRDSREERGLPYFAVRRRERIAGPVTLGLRRLFASRVGWRPGELVEVRSLPEILATLDEKGCLDGLPFMPEMVAYCGHRVLVHRRLEKVWEWAHGTGLRGVRGAVTLQSLRCDGMSHGGCQSACQLIWKEAWLKRPATDSTATLGTRRQLDLDAHTRIKVDGGLRYVCQMTEIQRASSQLSLRGLRHYWRDLWMGNSRFIPLLVLISVRLFNGIQWRLGRPKWPVLVPTDSDSSPQQDLGLLPGQMVRVKSKRAIELTLNRKIRNRGLEFGEDMIFYCGGSYRVAASINRVVHEGTGELLQFKRPSILLEGVTAIGGSVLNPQNEYYFWREIWLDPEPVSVEAGAGDPASLATAAVGEGKAYLIQSPAEP
jgi:hypothetical protein